MNRRYMVNWTKTARSDFYQIIAYIRFSNSQTADNTFRKIKAKAQALESFPDRGRLVPELYRHGIAEFRELIVPPWRIIYKIGGEQVTVFSVLDSRRNIEDLLLQRLLDLNRELPF